MAFATPYISLQASTEAEHCSHSDYDENGNVEPNDKTETAKSDSDSVENLKVKCQPMLHRKRRFTLSNKIEALQRIREGESRPKICREMGVAESTLRGWIKAEEPLRKAAQNPLYTRGEYVNTIDVEEKKQFVELDNALYSWFLNEQECGQKISVQRLKLEAEKLFLSLNPGKVYFRYINQFSQKFIKRHNIVPVFVASKLHDRSSLVPGVSWDVNCAVDALSDNNDISIKCVVGNYSEHMSLEKNTAYSGETTCSCYSGISHVFEEQDSSFSSKQHPETVCKNNTKPQNDHKIRNIPSSSTIVFYLKESLRWLESQVTCNCPCTSSGAVDIQNLIQMAKYKAKLEGQRKITDFFTKN